MTWQGKGFKLLEQPQNFGWGRHNRTWGRRFSVQTTQTEVWSCANHFAVAQNLITAAHVSFRERIESSMAPLRPHFKKCHNFTNMICPSNRVRTAIPILWPHSLTFLQPTSKYKRGLGQRFTLFTVFPIPNALLLWNQLHSLLHANQPLTFNLFGCY